MNIGFYTVMRADPQPFLHASSLVREAKRVMPDVPIVQLTDQTTPIVPGVSAVHRLEHGPMLQRRMEHYAQCEDDWLLVDTDVSLRQDVREVFDDEAFDVALTDRQWPHLPQQESVLQTMPFNTGVVFSRAPKFWQAVRDIWMTYPESERNWWSEQRAVYAAVRTGLFRVKILPGQIYNYPPQSQQDAPSTAAVLHYKGPTRKQWLTNQANQVLAEV